MQELRKRLIKLQKRLEDVSSKLDLGKKKKRVEELEAESAKPGFWDNVPRAQNLMEELSRLKDQIKKTEALEKKVEDSLAMIELIKGDPQTGQVPEETEMLNEVESIERDLKALELEIFLKGPHDGKNAILSIHAGQGGTEAMDWAEMLFRMYTRFLQSRGFAWELVDEVRGEEAGIKRATLMVEGPYAYGYLKGEAGTHRLVRLSPFDADHARHTSFALVEVLPQIEAGEVKVDPKEIEFEAFRASGHGGQRLNKVSTAVRLRHKPTGIVVTCQAERFQHRNREIALGILMAKLWALKEKERREKEAKLKGEYRKPGWGNQIRSYVLHPYRLVKDLRTGYETSDAQAVLDGGLDGFIEAELRVLA